MAEEKVCLDLMALYDRLKEYYSKKADDTDEWEYMPTEYHHSIRKDGDYYDLTPTYGGLMLCCDGEECVVTERTDEYVNLVSVSNLESEDLCGIDTIFTLSSEEFSIATGGKK